MKKVMILMLAVVVSGISYSQIVSNSGMLSTNIGNAQLTDINSAAPTNKYSSPQAPITNSLASEPANVSLDVRAIWSNALLMRRTHASNSASAADLQNGISRSVSPISSQLSKGVSQGISLSSDAKVFSNATVSASAISASNSGMGSAGQENGEVAGSTGLLGGSRPGSNPIGYVPVGNGIVVLLAFAGIYALLVAIRRMQLARTKK